MDPNTTATLPGQSPPISIITATDQSGIILIATALGLTIALISLLIRAYMQLQIRSQYLLDDFVAAGSMLLAIFQSVAVFIGVSKSFGKTIEDIPPSQLIQLQKAAYASELLYITTIWLTKCSVACLLLRLSPMKKHNLAAYTILGASTLFMVVSVFIIGFKCDMSEPWIFINTQCANLLVRWEVETTLDIITEFALFGASIYLVRGVQLSASKKSTVIFAFGLRLAVLSPAVIRLFYLNQELTSSNPTLHGALASVSTQIQISYAIVAETIPCLRPFVAVLSTNYGAPALRTSASGSKAQHQNEYNLSSLSKSGASGISRLGRSYLDKSQLSATKTPWDLRNHHASIISGDRHSTESQGSKEMIISRNTEWHIDHEGPIPRLRGDFDI